jgi:hypothetical protein
MRKFIRPGHQTLYHYVEQSGAVIPSFHKEPFDKYGDCRLVFDVDCTLDHAALFSIFPSWVFGCRSNHISAFSYLLLISLNLASIVLVYASCF